MFFYITFPNSFLKGTQSLQCNVVPWQSEPLQSEASRKGFH